MGAFQTKNILVTGATGLIGSRMVKHLQQLGHNICILSRDPAKANNVKAFKWDIERQEIDLACLEGVDTVIHLAGAGIAEKRWTKKRKKALIDSRVESIRLLYTAIEQTGTAIEAVISASGVGYYGNRGDEVLKEDAENGTGFLAECCKKWEDAVEEGAKYCSRIVKLRIGIVLSRHGGALVELERPVNYFVGAPLGTGKQWIPWIHLYDLLAIFENAVSNPEYNGVFNASSTFPVTNHEFSRILTKKLHRPLWPLNVPEFALRALLGEMSEVVLTSDRASSQKLIDHGFQFRYPGLEAALDEIYLQ
jgi:uncharacterized protein (TIGR01777 family)